MDKEERLKKFMQDEKTSTYVYEELREFFFKSRNSKDIYVLGGERIAQELFEKAWKDKLVPFKKTEIENKQSYKQVGL